MKQPASSVAINFKLHTGADTPVLPMSIFKQLLAPIQLCPTKTVPITFGGACMPCCGVTTLQCKIARHTPSVEFHVTRQADKTILGGVGAGEEGQHTHNAPTAIKASIDPKGAD